MHLTTGDVDVEQQHFRGEASWDTNELTGNMDDTLTQSFVELGDIAGGLDRNEVAVLRHVSMTVSAVLQGTTETVDTSGWVEATLSTDTTIQDTEQSKTAGDGLTMEAGVTTDPDVIMVLGAAAGGGFEDSASGVGGGSTPGNVADSFNFDQHDASPEYDRHNNLYLNFAAEGWDAQDATLTCYARGRLLYNVIEE